MTVLLTQYYALKKRRPYARHGGLRGSREIAPIIIINLDTDEGEWSSSRSSRFTPGEGGPRYPLNWRLRGFQSRSGRFGVKKDYAGNEPRFLSIPARNVVVASTTLSRTQIFKTFMF